jgi:hypothetical protein
VTCPEVRGRLTEHALGLLSNPDRREVDRHLEGCAGCRKESAELSEGAAAVGLALPLAEPPTSLEGRIVERLRMFTGKTKTPARGRVRVLAVAALAAALLAASGFGWAIAERERGQSQEERLRAQIEAINDQFDKFIGAHTSVVNVLPATGAENRIATLSPPPGQQGGGSVFISSQSGRGDPLDFLMVSVALPPNAEGTYFVQLVNGRQALRAGTLQPPLNPDGNWTLYSFTGYDLSEVLAVTILDSTGSTVLTGTVSSYTGA